MNWYFSGATYLSSRVGLKYNYIFNSCAYACVNLIYNKNIPNEMDLVFYFLLITLCNEVLPWIWNIGFQQPHRTVVLGYTIRMKFSFLYLKGRSIKQLTPPSLPREYILYSIYSVENWEFPNLTFTWFFLNWLNIYLLYRASRTIKNIMGVT